MNAVDLFAGAGGWSHGWRCATGREPVVAVDHCAHAVRLHALNHPTTEHLLEDLCAVEPRRAVNGRRIDWLHLSPDCTHFSRARGGKPRDQKIRGLAWVGVEWARHVRPMFLSLENVIEFTTWGPLDDDGHPVKARAGETFGEFVAQLRGLGYAVEWRVLCAADYGAPTIRKRMFLLARNDGQPICWPEPTHGPGRAQPWRTAAECIDWSLACPSIFGRKRPLAASTCRRIAAGIVRYVLRAHHAGDRHYLVASFMTQYYGTGGQHSRVDAPLPAVVTKARHGLVTVTIDVADYVLADIGLRMLEPRELARAQGFPDSYVLEGTKAEQIARIGNSVCPQVAEALVRANVGRSGARSSGLA